MDEFESHGQLSEKRKKMKIIVYIGIFLLILKVVRELLTYWMRINGYSVDHFLNQ